MASWADRTESIGLDATFAAVMVTGFSALAMIQCRQPARRRVWGRSSLIASLVVIPLVGLNPFPRLELPHPSHLFQNLGFRPDPPEASRTRPSPDPPGFVPEDADPSVPERPPTAGPAWPRAVRCGLMLAYGAGLSWNMTSLLLGLIGAQRLVRRATRASRSTEELLESLPWPHEISRRPPVLVSDRLSRPVLVGFWRPVILIPAQFEGSGAGPQLRLGLLHELAHREGGDHRFSLLAALAQSIWFFLPQVWWTRNQLRLDAEFLADHRAVSHFGTTYLYAESLVGLALEPASGQAHVGATAPPARLEPAAGLRPQQMKGLASALLQRVQMLLRCPFVVEDSPPRFWSATVVCLVGGWSLVASCLSVQDWHARPLESAEVLISSEVRAFFLAELTIAPQMFDDRPFDLRYRLPGQFSLVCEVLAEPAELDDLEILGYRLGFKPGQGGDPVDHGESRSPWRRIKIVRGAGNREAVHVDGCEVVAEHRQTAPASWLTIRPFVGRTTRLRHLRLSW